MQLGVVLAAFAWGYAIFQFPGGVLGDVIGARRALTILAALWGVLNLLVAFVPGTAAGSATAVVLALMTLRFLMGAAQAPLFPIIGGGTTCHWFPVSGWAFPNALQNFGATFGAAAAGPLIAWLMERFGWRASFLLTAPAALLVRGALVVVRPRSPLRAHRGQRGGAPAHRGGPHRDGPGAGRAGRVARGDPEPPGAAAHGSDISVSTTCSTSSSTGCSST